MKKMNTIKKLIGFTLLIEYPNCRKKIGDFEPLTTGQFLQYPLIWKPIYN